MAEPTLYATKEKEKQTFIGSIKQNVALVKSHVTAVKAVRTTVLNEKTKIQNSGIDAADKTGLMDDCDKIVAYIDTLVN